LMSGPFPASVPHSLLLKAVAHHTSERWVLLCISRWLEAPMQMPDGTIVPREKGTPQGSPISPLLANLFMHYAFDTWMDREFPGCPFERYADDIIAHCDSEDQARQLRAAIAARLETLGLELHPGKTKIAYARTRTAGETSGIPASISSATPSGAAWPRAAEAISLASPRSSAPQRGRRRASRSGTGTSTAAAARTCPPWPGRSIPRSRAGSTITEPSTAPSCASWHGASTSTWPGGPCTSSSDSAASTPKRWPGCKRCISTSHACSLTGS
jgi:hypothetical protein